MKSSTVENSSLFLTADRVSKLPARERIGFNIEARDAKEAIAQICDAEKAGVRQVWMASGGSGKADTLTVYAGAAIETSQIRLGTSIVPIYPRSPLVMALQTLAINDVATDRFRLGVGTSHRQYNELTCGIPMRSPLNYLREYVELLRSGLWEGNMSHHGRFFNINSTFPRKAHVPILVSALGLRAFQVAGEISDGVISWFCPTSYLLGEAMANLKAGAEACHRPRPPLVAHIPVCLSDNAEAAKLATRKRLEFYLRSFYYIQMYAQAGFKVNEDGSGSDAIIEELLIHGDESTVKVKLLELLGKGVDEILVYHVSVANEEKERSKLFNLIGSL